MSRPGQHLNIMHVDGRSQWAARCSGCGAVGSVPSAAPPEAAKKTLERRGWVFRTTEKMFCPACAESRKGPKTMSNAPSRPPVLAAVPAPTAAPAAPPTPPRQMTAEEKRRVREALLTHFDDEMGRYTIGWDDARVAKETATPAASVATFREIVFGPLRPDPEIAAIKAEIDKMLGRLAELSDRVRKIEGR